MRASGSHHRSDIGEWVASTLSEIEVSGNVSVPTWRLNEVAARPPLHTYATQIWARRFFIIADSRAKAFATSRGTVLGKLWLVLRPFLDGLIFFIIFGLLLRTGRDIDNFLAYLMVGINMFTLVQVSLTSGGAIIPGAKNMLRAFSFPRASLVVSWALRNLLDFIPVLIATMAFIIVVPPHVMPGLTWVFIIPVVCLAWLFSLGIALLTASLTARVPDLKFIWPLISRFWFYGSCIFFSLDRFVDHELVYSIMTANPGFQILKMARDTLVYNTIPAAGEWAYLGIWAVGMLILGFIVFWSHEESYGRES